MRGSRKFFSGHTEFILERHAYNFKFLRGTFIYFKKFSSGKTSNIVLGGHRVSVSPRSAPGLTVCKYITWSYCNVFVNSTAEKKNIPWREMTKEILDSDVYKLMDDIQDTSLVYPDCNISFDFITCFV